MGKIRHRIFEMYESREEALRELIPDAASLPTESRPAALPACAGLTVTTHAGVTTIRFKAKALDEATDANLLGADFAQLADTLPNGSKILLDFTQVTQFDAGLIEPLVLFHKRLRNKGSRIVLCCLASAVLESFFPVPGITRGQRTSSPPGE